MCTDVNRDVGCYCINDTTIANFNTKGDQKKKNIKSKVRTNISPSIERTLKAILTIHGIITFAAAVVLIVTPASIPKSVDIKISSDQYLICYFLGAAELAIAFLSLFARKIEDKKSLRLISSTFIVFHLATGGLETFVLTQGASSKIIYNVVLRIIIAVLFWYYGIQKPQMQK